MKKKKEKREFIVFAISQLILGKKPRQEIESLFTISRNAKAHRISQQRPDTSGDRYRKIHRTRATPLFYLSARR